MYKIFFLIYIFICTKLYADTNIVYRIKHFGDRILVQAQFDGYGCITKLEELYIPENVWGADYGKQIKDIKIIKNSYCTSSKHDLKHKSNIDNSSYSIEYTINNLEHNDLVDTFGSRYYHFFDNNSFFLFGLGFFVRPKNLLTHKDEKISIIIDSNVKQIISTKTPYNCNNIETNIGSLDSIVIVGNKNLDIVQNKNLNISIIVPYLNNNFFKKISNIVLDTVKKEQNFFDDKFNNSKMFLIVPAPFFDSKKNTCGGTVIDNAAIIFLNHNTVKDEDITEVIMHESLHFWIGNNGFVSGPTWVREGFTDYLVDKINYHYSGKKIDFINKYNHKLQKYFITMVDNIPDSIIDDNFFSFKLTEKIYYLKGYIILAQIDSIINLRNALKSIIKNCKTKKDICIFSSELLSKNIKMQKHTINLIEKIMSNIETKKLNQTFLGAKLLSKNIQVEQIPNFVNIIKNGYIDSYNINSLKFRDKKYIIHEVLRENSGKLEMYIRIGKDIYSVPLKTYKNKVEVPYYE